MKTPNAEQLAAEQARVIVNQKAGSGTAYETAQEIQRETGVASVDFLRLLHQKLVSHSPENGTSQVEYAQHLLKLIKLLFVVGGDGSAFSILQLLNSLPLEEVVSVIALANGGENALSKYMNTYKDPAGVVTAALAGDMKYRSLQTLSAQTDTKSYTPIWSILAGGISVDTLQRIEEKRNAGVPDWCRRYFTPGQTVWDAKQGNITPVTVDINGTQYTTLEAGVTNTSFLNRYGKWKLPTTEDSRATLHMLTGVAVAQAEPSLHLKRFLLDMALLTLFKQGLSIPEKFYQTLKFIQLMDDYSVTFTSQNSKISIDSEIRTAEAVIIRPGKVNENIQVGYRTK